jgi:heme exporter protein D
VEEITYKLLSIEEHLMALKHLIITYVERMRRTLNPLSKKKKRERKKRKGSNLMFDYS